MLKEVAESAISSHGTSVLSAEEYMDDGSLIKLTVSLDKDEVGVAYSNQTSSSHLIDVHLSNPYSTQLFPTGHGCSRFFRHRIPGFWELQRSKSRHSLSRNLLTQV